MKRLSDEAITEAFDGDFGEVFFDHKPTAEEIFLIKLKLVARATEDARDKEWIEWLDDNNVIAIHKDKSLNELGWLITMEKRRSLKQEEE